MSTQSHFSLNDPEKGVKSSSLNELSSLVGKILATPVIAASIALSDSSLQYATNPIISSTPQRPRRLSESPIWQIQTDYYSEMGISAWEKSVPFMITNSAYFAETYADIIISFLRDYQSQLDPTQPLHILELSAGTGRFTFLLLKEISRKIQHFPALKEFSFKYVMTDITEGHLDFWQAHERLKPFIEAGILDMAVYRAEEGGDIHLRHSGKILSPGDLKNPMIVIANYLFDTIRHDFFRVENQQLLEGLTTLVVGPDNVPADPKHIEIADMRLTLDYEPVVTSQYYQDPKLNAVLDEYRTLLDQEDFIIPVGAFNSLAHLRQLSPNGLVVLSSDKGYTSVGSMKIQASHGFAVHGSFSYPVNFDAINRYYSNNGKPVFCTQDFSTDLHTACYLDLPGLGEQDNGLTFENTALVFEEKIVRTSPSTSLIAVHIMAHSYAPVEHSVHTVNVMIGVLKASYNEPQLFSQFAPLLMQSIHLATPSQVIDLIHIMRNAWENYYYFKGVCRLPFWISQIYDCLGCPEESLYFLEQTAKLFGAHETLYFLMGDCQERLNRVEEAKAHYSHALELNGDFSDAQERLQQITVEAA